MMFHDLEHQANCALRSMCKKSISSPLMAEDVGYLALFTKAVERLLGSTEKVRKLVDEGSRDLLARVSTRVFSHLLRSDTDFDFEAVTAPVPRVIQGALGDWVEDHVDALVRAFTSEDDAVVVAADGGDVVDDGDAGAGDGGGGVNDGDSDASSASEDDTGDAASDISG